MNNTLTKSRTPYVDIAKGLAILSVVLLHVDYVYPKLSFVNINGMLGWFWHVPVFFLIGGFFLKDERLANPVLFIKGKMKSLYLLALYIYLPATLLHNAFFDWGWYSTEAVYGDKIIAEWDVKEYALGIIKTLLCAGREPIMGAMWFVYVLLFALCGYSIIVFIVNKCKWGGYCVPVILLALQTASCIFTNVYGLTIPRFSNAISVMLLLYIGQQLHGKLQVKFDNPYLLVAALLIVYESSLLTGNVFLNHNSFKDVLHLTVGSTAALYVICYVSKKLEGCRIGKWLELCGRESFYIMGLHIVGFKLCTMALMGIGVVDGGLERLMTPEINGNILLLLVYTACGMVIPLILIASFRKVKSLIIRK